MKRRRGGWTSWSGQLLHSFSLKLILLALILLAAPIVIYWQFQRAEQERLVTFRNAVDQTGRTVAAMLKPYLENFHSQPPDKLREAMNAAAIEGTRIKLLLHPASAPAHEFFYIAAAPSVSIDYLNRERRELYAAGILNRLTPTCDRSENMSVRFKNPMGVDEFITSVTPVHIDNNCWVVIAAKSEATLNKAATDGIFAKNATMRAFALIYVLSAALVLLLFVHMWRNVKRFRSAARRIRLRRAGDVSFRELNSIPELRGVADDFDSLVNALVESEQFIKRTAEENTHALKAPLAVIAQSIEPLRRIVPPSDEAGQRSLQLIERSIAKFDTIVSASRDMEAAIAEGFYPETSLMNLSDFLRDLLHSYEEILRPQGKRIVSLLADDIHAYANEDIMEAVMENLLENATSFTPKDGVIEITLYRDNDFARIRIADRGPGVAERNLPRIFDRYASFRSPKSCAQELPPAAESHQGLGLWIVKRNVEGLGGMVSANIRSEHCFEVTVSLRMKL
jgi:two-component system sensor histidine kinase ChvG